MTPENINTDIISDSNTEEIIKRRRKNLEAIFDSVPIGLLLIDENLIIVRVNNAIRKMLNKDYPEIINRHIGEAFGCSILEKHKTGCGLSGACQKCHLTQNIKKVFETSKSVNELEYQNNINSDRMAQKTWFLMNIEPVVIDDVRYAVVCLDNITDKKLAAEKLIETMEIKSQFISTVSHELRTPLTAIREGINIVLEGLAGRVKKKQKEFLTLAKRNVDRLSMLINDVLDFQKLESGRMKFHFAPCKVLATLHEAVETMQLFARKNKIKLTTNFAADLEEAVFDHDRIIQVLTNLLSNAIKFTPTGGNVTLDCVRQNNEIIITLSDTGMGIPKDDLPKIFERFYRVKRQGKEIQGTGLGLPIVAQIINAHNGRVLVDSELNKGTTFTVYLPVNPASNGLDDSADETLEKTITG